MSVSIDTLEQLKAKLLVLQDLGMPVKTDLYAHLTEVFNRLNLHNAHNGFDKFEDISGLVKRTNFEVKNFQKDEDLNNSMKVVSNAQAIALIEKAQKFILSRSQPINLSQRVDCFLDNTEMLEWAGVSFGENTNILI